MPSHPSLVRALRTGPQRRPRLVPALFAFALATSTAVGLTGSAAAASAGDTAVRASAAAAAGSSPCPSPGSDADWVLSTTTFDTAFFRHAFVGNGYFGQRVPPRASAKSLLPLASRDRL